MLAHVVGGCPGIVSTTSGRLISSPSPQTKQSSKPGDGGIGVSWATQMPTRRNATSREATEPRFIVVGAIMIVVFVPVGDLGVILWDCEILVGLLLWRGSALLVEWDMIT